MNGHQASREPGHRNQNLFLSQYFSMNYIVNKISEENAHLWFWITCTVIKFNLSRTLVSLYTWLFLPRVIYLPFTPADLFRPVLNSPKVRNIYSIKSIRLFKNCLEFSCWRNGAKINQRRTFPCIQYYFALMKTGIWRISHLVVLHNYTKYMYIHTVHLVPLHKTNG